MTAGPAIPGDGNAITVDWMQQALLAGSAMDVPRIRSVEVESIGTGLGLLADLFRCRLTYGDVDDESQDDAPGRPKPPESVVVKLPSSQPKSRRLCKRFELYKRECHYYRRLAAHVPLRTPTLLYGDYEPRSDRFVLVLEDLCDMATADQIAGATPEQAKRAVRGIAKLNGHYWNKVDQPALAGSRAELSPKYRPLVQIVYLANLVRTTRLFGGMIPNGARRTLEAYGPRVAEHMGILAAGPMTFAHGDFRLDNMFFADDEDFAVIDWQVSGIQSGLYDVAYFMATSVATGVRRQVEREALMEFHDIVRGMGAKDLAFEDCWRLYRHNSLGRAITAIITCGGLDLNDERSYQLAEISLQRTLTVIEDLDADELIPGSRTGSRTGSHPGRPRTPVLPGIFAGLSRGAYRFAKALSRP
ncbi:MAG: phosphotransferase [Gammaproteobacteria bacterium]|nr:phosphotransferase [Gammaproteobacteria bacterium]